MVNIVTMLRSLVVISYFSELSFYAHFYVFCCTSAVVKLCCVCDAFSDFKFDGTCCVFVFICDTS